MDLCTGKCKINIAEIMSLCMKKTNEISNGKEKSYDRSHYFLAQRVISFTPVQRHAKVRISGERNQIEEK